MLKRKRNETVLVTCIVMSICTASIGHAGDYSAPGSNCVDDKGYIRYSGGDAENGNNSNITNFYCPIVRYGLTTSDLTNLYVSIIDQHSSMGVECTVVSSNLHGLRGTLYSSTAITSDAWRGINILSMGSVAGFSYGRAVLHCRVPDADAGYSGINGYRWSD